MKAKLTRHLLAALLFVAFASETRAQLPNAWQINDNSSSLGFIQYVTNLTPAQVESAQTNGWRYDVVSRMVSDNGAAAAHSMAFGDGTRRFYIFFDLDASGELTAQLLGGATYTLTAAATATNYHTHELQYDPVTSNATYRVDGVTIASWPGQLSAGQADQVMWGPNSSSGRGIMNYHHAEFEIIGSGIVAAYDAGFAGNPANAPSPTTQGWTRFTSGAAILEAAVSPDEVPLGAGDAFTLNATAILPTRATLNATIYPSTVPTSCYWEYGTTTNYGSVTGTQVISSNPWSSNSVATTVNGLASDTTYHCRVVMSNPGGEALGDDVSFTTPPYITTLGADSFAPGEAHLQGQANPSGSPALVWFEWGATTNYGYATAPQAIGAGFDPVDISGTATNLTRITNYQYRAVCSNFVGILYGHNQSFVPSGFILTNVPGLPGVAVGAAVAWGDYDNDGRLDFLITGSGISQLWRNTGGGFTNVTATAAPGLPQVFNSAVAWGDYDNDGRLDFLITGSGVSQLWRNTGSGFTNVTASIAPGLPGVSQGAVAWGDYDNDGRLDFLLAGASAGGSIFQFWRNTGSGFTNVTASIAPGLPGVSQAAVAWSDYDNDGRLDFLLTGYSTSGSISEIWRNTGSGFTNVTASIAPGLPGVSAGAVAWGDYDNDGWLDFLLTGSSTNGWISQIWRNTGNGFTNVTASVAPGLPGVEFSSVAWGDYDSDGRLDFLLTGYVSQLWRNTGSGFTNETATIAPGLPPVFQGSVAWGDYDHDGRLDFLLTGNNSIVGKVSQLWRNIVYQTNMPPGAPTGLAMTATTNAVMLSWNSAVDDHTPATGLTYNVRAGTTPGGIDLFAGQVDAANGFRRVPAMGNAYLRHSLPLTGVTNGETVYWSVQAVDTSFAGGPFATETSVVSLPQLAITPSDATNAIVSWSPPTWGWHLQESPSLSPAAWSASPSGELNPTTMTTTNGTTFYRLSDE